MPHANSLGTIDHAKLVELTDALSRALTIVASLCAIPAETEAVEPAPSRSKSPIKAPSPAPTAKSLTNGKAHHAQEPIPAHLVGTHDAIARLGTARRDQVAQATGTNVHTMTGHLRQLYKAGLLKRSGSFPKYRYSVSNADTPAPRGAPAGKAEKLAKEPPSAWNLTSTEQHILALAKTLPGPFSRAEVLKVEKTKKHPIWVSKILTRLTSLGLLVRAGGGNRIFYQVAGTTPRPSGAKPNGVKKLTNLQRPEWKAKWLPNVGAVVLQAVRNADEMLTSREISLAIGKSQTWVNYGLKYLVATGAVRRVQHGQLIRYTLPR